MSKMSLLAIALTALSPGSLFAQADERTSSDLATDCRLAAEVVQANQRGPERDRALQQLRVCNESGAAALARAWSAAWTDSAELDRLYWSSAALLDARLLDAVRDAAARASLPLDLRLNALRVLAAYVDPQFDAQLSELRPAQPGETSPRTLFVSHRARSAGTRPLPATYATDIIQLFAQLAANDGDPTVRFAADRLHRQLGPR